MGLQGSYNFKGIALSDAYLQVGGVKCDYESNSSQSVKTPPVYNSDGSIETDAVYETVWLKAPTSSVRVKVFKDKAIRDANPYSQLTEFVFTFNGSVAASAKNHVKQAYIALKEEDKYKEFTDV
tara:strand:- start:403 stop:774 length:372 start_codon:yes stop_codon:yes gene_type:complete